MRFKASAPTWAGPFAPSLPFRNKAPLYPDRPLLFSTSNSKCCLSRCIISQHLIFPSRPEYQFQAILRWRHMVNVSNSFLSPGPLAWEQGSRSLMLRKSSDSSSGSSLSIPFHENMERCQPYKAPGRPLFTGILRFPLHRRLIVPSSSTWSPSSPFSLIFCLPLRPWPFHPLGFRLALLAVARIASHNLSTVSSRLLAAFPT